MSPNTSFLLLTPKCVLPSGEAAPSFGSQYGASCGHKREPCCLGPATEVSTSQSPLQYSQT